MRHHFLGEHLKRPRGLSRIESWELREHDEMCALELFLKLLDLARDLIRGTNHRRTTKRRVTDLAVMFEGPDIFIAWCVIGFGKNMTVELHHAVKMWSDVFPGFVFCFCRIYQ